MVIVGGVTEYGQIENEDGSVDVTRFVHQFLLPLIPLFTTRTEANGQSHRIGLQPRSVALGYLRVLALPLGLFLARMGFTRLMMRDLETGWFLVAAATALIVGAAASWTWLGRRTRRTGAIVLAHVLTGVPLFLLLALSGIVTAATLHAAR